jgi:hypothetical protein
LEEEEEEEEVVVGSVAGEAIEVEGGAGWHKETRAPSNGGGGMARLPRIYSRAPALRPLLHRRRSCPRGSAARRQAPSAKRRGAARAPPRTRLAARGTPIGSSSYFLGPPWLMSRGPNGAEGAAQKRRCPVN